MPRIVDHAFDEAFARDRDSLLAVARARLPEHGSELPGVRGWLDKSFSESIVRATLKDESTHRRARDLGQPNPPVGRRTGTPPSRPEPAPEARGDALRADRLERALRCLHAKNEEPDLLRLLGPNLPRGQREVNALRAVVVSACILDPDAAEWLGDATDLAASPWVGDGTGLPRIKGRAEVCQGWGHEALAMLGEAAAVLGWRGAGPGQREPTIGYPGGGIEIRAGDGGPWGDGASVVLAAGDGGPGGKGGDLRVEAGKGYSGPPPALRLLDTRPSWRLNELPPDVTIDVLRVLDADGLIEVCAWYRQNETTDPRRPKPLVPKRSNLGWVSPVANPSRLGTWDRLWEESTREPEVAAEVRITERGKAELAKQNLEKGTGESTRKTASAPTSPPPPALTPGEQAVWDALAGHAGSAMDLGRDARIATSEQTIREHVKSIRSKLGARAIDMRRGFGYFRPDAPPDWAKLKPKRQRRIRPT